MSVEEALNQHATVAPNHMGHSAAIRPSLPLVKSDATRPEMPAEFEA